MMPQRPVEPAKENFPKTTTVLFALLVVFVVDASLSAVFDTVFSSPPLFSALIDGIIVAAIFYGIFYSLNEKPTAVLVHDLLKFKLAVENSSNHIIITDVDGKILYANKAAEAVTGYSKNEMIGQRPSLWGNQMGQEYYKNFWHVIKNEKKTFVGEVNNKRKNGEQYIAAVSISPVLDEKGVIKFFVGIERDITKEKEIDRAKTEFVSIAAHQLRTPLAIIRWYGEMLLGGRRRRTQRQSKKFFRRNLQWRPPDDYAGKHAS